MGATAFEPVSHWPAMLLVAALAVMTGEAWRLRLNRPRAYQRRSWALVLAGLALPAGGAIIMTSRAPATAAAATVLAMIGVAWTLTAWHRHALLARGTPGLILVIGAGLIGTDVLPSRALPPFAAWVLCLLAAGGLWRRPPTSP